jgi:hypothetical protein
MEQWEIEQEDTLGVVYFGNELMIDDVVQVQNVKTQLIDCITEKEQLFHEIKLMEYANLKDSYEYEKKFNHYRNLDSQYIEFIKLLVVASE